MQLALSLPSLTRSISAFFHIHQDIFKHWICSICPIIYPPDPCLAIEETNILHDKQLHSIKSRRQCKSQLPSLMELPTAGPIGSGSPIRRQLWSPFSVTGKDIKSCTSENLKGPCWLIRLWTPTVLWRGYLLLCVGLHSHLLLSIFPSLSQVKD